MSSSKSIDPTPKVQPTAPVQQDIADKKKKKKKRTKKKKQADDELETSDDEIYVPTPNPVSQIERSDPVEARMVDPIQVTIDEVVSRTGFDKETVRECVSNMYERGERYDHIETVVEQLLQESENPKGQVEQPVAPAVPQHYSEEASSPVTQSVTAPIPLPAYNGSTTISHEPETTGSDSPVRASQTKISLSGSPHIANVNPLAQKLEIAASFENVLDALSALVQWTNIASPDQVVVFVDSRACEILLQNCLRSADIMATLDAKNLLTALLTKILDTNTKGAGIFASSGTIGHSVAHAVLRLCDNLLTIKSLREGSSEQALQTHIEVLAKRVAKSIQTYRSLASNPASTATRLLDMDGKIRECEEAGVMALQRQSDANSRLKNLLMARDLLSEGYKLSLEGYSMVQKGSGSFYSHTHSFASVDDDTLLLQTLASASGASPRSLQAKRQSAHMLKSSMEALNRECDAKLYPLNEEIRLCNHKMVTLRTQHADLMRQLKDVEQEISGVSARRAALEASAEDVKRQYDPRILNTESSGLMTDLRMGEVSEALIGSLKELEGALQLQLQFSGQTNSSWLRNEVTDRQNCVLRIAANYLESEAQCMSILRTRIGEAGPSIQKLLKEINLYKAIGVESIAQERQTACMQLQESTAEDTNALTVLASSAKQTLDQIAQLVRDAKAEVRLNPSRTQIHSHAALETETLRRICVHASSCGLDIPVELAETTTSAYTNAYTGAIGSRAPASYSQFQGLGSMYTHTHPTANSSPPLDSPPGIEVMPQTHIYTQAPQSQPSRAMPNSNSNRGPNPKAKASHPQQRRAPQSTSSAAPAPAKPATSSLPLKSAWGKKFANTPTQITSITQIQAEQKTGNVTGNDIPAPIPEEPPLPTADISPCPASEEHVNGEIGLGLSDEVGLNDSDEKEGDVESEAPLAKRERKTRRAD